MVLFSIQQKLFAEMPDALEKKLQESELVFVLS